jgi:hypothetical protein
MFEYKAFVFCELSGLTISQRQFSIKERFRNKVFTQRVMKVTETGMSLIGDHLAAGSVTSLELAQGPASV